MKVYIVNDHQDGTYGRIVGVFGSREQGDRLIGRYQAAYEGDDAWPSDLQTGVYVYGLAVDEYDVELDRLAEAEAIITALRGLETAMYNSDLEASWPREATDLQNAYESKYDVNLYPPD